MQSKLNLTFSPMAWLKLQWFCHAGNTEVSGFGISSDDNLLYIEDFAVIKQQNTIVSTSMDPIAIADFTDDCVDKGMKPQQFLRIWCHTHPDIRPTPSGADEKNFRESFGKCDWAVMFIVNWAGETYCRLKILTAFGFVTEEIPVRVDWKAIHQLDWDLMAELEMGWNSDYEECVIDLDRIDRMNRHRQDQRRDEFRRLIHAAMFGDQSAKQTIEKDYQDFYQEVRNEFEIVQPPAQLEFLETSQPKEQHATITDFVPFGADVGSEDFRDSDYEYEYDRAYDYEYDDAYYYP